MRRNPLVFVGCCLLITFAAAVAAPTIAAAQATPPDEVRTTDGGIFRGVIVENVPGDHLIILLPTGESRRIPAAEIASTGVVMPSASAAASPDSSSRPDGARPTASAAVVGNGELRIDVASATPGLTLYAGEGGIGASPTTCFERCELRMSRGIAVFAVQDARGRMRPVPGRHLLQQDGHLDFQVNSRRGARIAMGLSGLSIAALSLAFFIPDYNYQWDDYAYGRSLTGWSFATGLGLAMGGGMLMAFTALVPDNGRVRFTPYGGPGSAGLSMGGSF